MFSSMDHTTPSVHLLGDFKHSAKNMKIILTTIASSIISLSFNVGAEELLQVESKTILLTKKSPITLKSGVYTDGQVQLLNRILSQYPKTSISQQPMIVFGIDDTATIQTPSTKIENIQLSKDKERSTYTLTGSYEDLVSKEKLSFNGTLNIGEWLLKIEGDRAIILSVTKVQDKRE